MKRFKVTRIEIWEVVDANEDQLASYGVQDFQDSTQDDILNSQDVGHETDDGCFEFTPKELVELKVEAAN